MRTVTYKTKEEREQLIAAAELNKEIMEHDELINPAEGVWQLTFVTESELPVSVKYKSTETLVNEAVEAIALGDIATAKSKLKQLFNVVLREPAPTV